MRKERSFLPEKQQIERRRLQHCDSDLMVHCRGGVEKLIELHLEN